MSKKDLDTPSKHRHMGPDSTAPYPVSRMAPATELVDLAKEIATADEMIGLKVNNKLQVIADQIRSLQKTAHTILEEANRDQQLNLASCNFKKIAGRIYHLYQKTNGKRYISMLSPGDWKNMPPDEFMGSYRFEADFSWTPVEKLETPNDTQALIQGLLGKHP